MYFEEIPFISRNFLCYLEGFIFFRFNIILLRFEETRCTLKKVLNLKHCYETCLCIIFQYKIICKFWLKIFLHFRKFHQNIECPIKWHFFRKAISHLIIVYILFLLFLVDLLIFIVLEKGCINKYSIILRNIIFWFN